MSESGYYPPGAEHDPRAPWNQPEPVECPDCHGTGKMREIDLRGMNADQADRALAVAQEAGNPTCDRCEGTGYVNPEDVEDDGPDPDDLRDAELDRRMNDDR